jgi:pimeloyl-ACP methyl ester carboxylesterase
MPEVKLSQGTVHYRDVGSGPVVVLIHGILVNGTVWEPLVERLSRGARCIVPDLPLGSHRTPMKHDADLSPPGLAALVAEFLERLELDDVTLVGNDTGGALCQLVCAKHPARIARLVLTNCDAFENFPPRAIAPAVKAIAKVPGSVAALDLLARLPAVRRLSMSIAPLTVEPVPDALLRGWVAPLHSRAVRHDLVRVARHMKPEHTLAAAEQLGGFDRPALIVWGMRDRFFPAADGERLAQTLPDARLVRIENARTFVQLDVPDRLAELIIEFAAAPETSARAAH